MSCFYKNIKKSNISVDTPFREQGISLWRIVWVTINCCFMSKMLPTWLNVSCRCRNWNIACPSCTSNFGLRCTRLGRTGCPEFCLQITMTRHDVTDCQVSTHQHANRYLPLYRAYI
jgi:hypothetical protein